jgi:group I intron endonuclease
MVVYKTTNIFNGKIYVGKDEFNNQLYLGSGYILKKAIKKYGKENFKKEIIEECQSRESLEDREIYWIKTLNATDPGIGYNIAEGGTGGNTYFGKTEKEMIEIKSKISKSGKGRVFSEEHRKKLADSARRRKGNKPSKFKGMKYEDYMDSEKAGLVKQKVSEGAKRPMSEETKIKISNNNTGRNLGPKSDKHKENLSVAKGTPITINGITYRSINHASAELGLSKYKIKQLGLSSTQPW